MGPNSKGDGLEENQVLTPVPHISLDLDLDLDHIGAALSGLVHKAWWDHGVGPAQFLVRCNFNLSRR